MARPPRFRRFRDSAHAHDRLGSFLGQSGRRGAACRPSVVAVDLEARNGTLTAF
jgi:hypothetical protein